MKKIPYSARVKLVDWLCIVGGGLMMLVVAMLLVTAAMSAANAHEGLHPVECADVPDIPDGITCYEPGTHPEPHDETYHLFHPVCEGVAPGEGSAAGRPYWYECLPETGRDNAALAVFGGMALAAGATMLILNGRIRARELD